MASGRTFSDAAAISRNRVVLFAAKVLCAAAHAVVCEDTLGVDIAMGSAVDGLKALTRRAAAGGFGANVGIPNAQSRGVTEGRPGFTIGAVAIVLAPIPRGVIGTGHTGIRWRYTP